MSEPDRCSADGGDVRFCDSPSSSSPAQPVPLALAADAAHRLRAVPSFSSCGLERLASVEVQLVLQWLDTTSRLRAARCSRRLMHEAADPFSWQGALFAVRSDAPDAANRICASRLLHSVPVHLTLAAPASFHDLLGGVAPVAAFPHVHWLDGSALHPHLFVHGVTEFWLHLLSHPAMQQLRSLTLPAMGRQEKRVLELVAGLPHLHTLRCDGSADEGPDRFVPLGSAPALTSLAVSAGTFGRFLRPALAVCTRLRTFDVSCLMLGMRPGELIDLCAEPTMRSLTRLNLRGVSPASTNVALLTTDYATAFAQLHCLHTLELESVVAVDLLLPHLAQAPALRTLILTVGPYILVRSLPNAFRHTVPSVPVLRALLDASASLRVELRAPRDRAAWDALAARRGVTQVDEWPSVEAIDHAQMTRVQREIVEVPQP